MDNNNGSCRREQLCSLIHQWNSNRLPLFSLSEPNQDMEFYGVMRFYYKEPGEKISTKCIRVSSLATTSDVIEALIEKFKPDMRMLTQDASYEILEVHEGGEERKLDIDEHPLIVQLSWHTNDREGRFLLRSSETPQYLPLAALQFDNSGIKRTNKRFSKRDKKESKKANKISADFLLNSDDIGQRLYEEVPQNTFTRTISSKCFKDCIDWMLELEINYILSDPEAVMRKKREQKLENKLKEISYNGSHGGSLKIYGAELVPSRPYVTLLVSEHDTAYKVLKAALEKYGLEKERVEDFVLVEVTFASNEGALSRSFSDLKTAGHHRERCLLDDECPLVSLSQSLMRRDVEVIFALRIRPSNFPPQYFGERASPVKSMPSPMQTNGVLFDPVLLPIANNGNQSAPFLLQKGLNEVGSDFSISGLMLRSPAIQPRHCVLDFSDGVVTLAALDSNASVELNGNLINCSVILRDADVLRLGGVFEFVFHSSYSGHQNNNPPECEGQQFPANKYTTSSTTTQFGVVTNDAIPVPPSTSSMMTLPALLEIHDQVSEDQLLQELVDRNSPNNYAFRLSPAFCFYMVCRHRLMPPDQFHRSNSLYYKERLRSVPAFVNSIINRVYHAIHVNPHNKEMSLFWLANISEFLHIIKRDSDLNALIGQHLQSQIMEVIERCLELHVEACKMDLQLCMPAFLDLNNSGGEEARNIVHLLNDLVLSYRRSRLNPALIIQSFSQLFHFINMYAFNWLIGSAGNMNLTRMFGVRFRNRLQTIYQWAEKQGLEFAAECHMDRITQTLKLLILPKTIDQLGNLGSTCYKLNSIQISFLLEYYLPDHNEMPVSHKLIDNLVHLARTQADKSAQEEGVRIQLEEHSVLGLPFLFPQDGYVVDTQRGIPSDMLQLIMDLERAGIGRLIQYNTLNGLWTAHMANQQRRPSMQQHVPGTIVDSEYASVQSNRYTPVNNTLASNMSQLSMENNRSQPQRIFVQIRRPNGAGVGLSIVAAQGIGDRYLGIYVKKVVEGSIAYREGHLETGDQLLSVNNVSLLNVTQEFAAQKIAEAGEFVQLEVAKNAASFNGLDSWLRNTSFVRRSQPQLSGISHQPSMPAIPNTSDLNNRHYRSASTSELYSQADTISINSNQPSARQQPRYRSAQRPQIILQDKQQPGLRAEPPPLYSAINATRSSSTVPFNVMPSYSSSAVPRPHSPQKSVSTSSFPVSGRRSAPLFSQLESEVHQPNKNSFDDYQNGNTHNASFVPVTRSAANIPLNNRTQKMLQFDRRVAPVIPNPIRSDYKLPFLNEINTKFNEINSNREKQPSSTSVRFHPDDFVNKIEQLEQTANACDVPRGALRETGSPDERQRKRVQFATEVSGDDLKENGHTSTSSNASDSPRSEQPQKASNIHMDTKIIESTSALNDDDEDNEPRVQILGAHEVYNDPRQRLLNAKADLQAKALKPVPDGSNLNFRDKMKMFASQLGEQSPKDRFKSSSAQREIEQDS
ncbi:Afadin [Aphelenchoides bicaudatus]|nr:Afadin [Aphelenchoides bicaudatus]